MAKKSESVAKKAKTERPGKTERRAEERRTGEVAVERRKVQRRRQIDPTTCERDYSGEEIEFMDAMDAYKRANGRMFPTCSEILEVIRGLGYVRPAANEIDEQFENEQETVGAVVAGNDNLTIDFDIDDELSFDE